VKRLVTLTAAAAVVLFLVSLTYRHTPGRQSTTAPVSPAAASDATEVARSYLTALLTADLATAEAQSTPLLATHLAAQPPQPTAADEPPRIDLSTLDQGPGWADLAAELHWPDGRLAALRVQLDLLDGRWLVAGVRP
jgi:hypothetical protein